MAAAEQNKNLAAAATTAAAVASQDTTAAPFAFEAFGAFAFVVAASQPVGIVGIADFQDGDSGFQPPAVQFEPRQG